MDLLLHHSAHKSYRIYESLPNLTSNVHVGIVLVGIGQTNRSSVLYHLPFILVTPWHRKFIAFDRQCLVLKMSLKLSPIQFIWHLFRHRDIFLTDVFSTDIFSTDTFQTGHILDRTYFRPLNKMRHIFDPPRLSTLWSEIAILI